MRDKRVFSSGISVFALVLPRPLQQFGTRTLRILVHGEW